MDKFIKKVGLTSILTSIVFALIGLIMICYPTTTMKFISTIIGVFFIVVGVIKLINYFVGKGNDSTLFTNDIAWGLMAIILGLVTIVYSSAIESILRIMIGIWIIYSGFMRFTLSFRLKETIDTKLWAFVLVLAVAMIVGGMYVTFYPGALVVTLGVIILVYAIVDLIESFIFMRNMKDML